MVAILAPYSSYLAFDKIRTPSKNVIVMRRQHRGTFSSIIRLVLEGRESIKIREVSGMNMKHPNRDDRRPTGKQVEATQIDIMKVLLQCGIDPERWNHFVSSVNNKRP